MIFEEAKKFVLPFGRKYPGKTLDEIASTDEGLEYLDWLAGRNVYGRAGEALKTYLADPSIQNELGEVIR